ncbi:MAG: hypothetical protein ABW139_15190 [Candidatus Thiodiazotropha sp. DIVDIV]
MNKNQQIVLFFILSVLMSSCALIIPKREWSEAESFRTKLSCGQSIKDISEIALKFGVTKINNPKHQYASFEKSGTTFQFYFNDFGLESFQEMRFSGSCLTCLDASVRSYLCKDKKTGYPMLHIEAPPELFGATIYLNANKLGQLCNKCGPKATLNIGIHELNFGIHTLTFKKEGYILLKDNFEYLPKSYWPKQQSIFVKVDAGQLARFK